MTTTSPTITPKQQMLIDLPRMKQWDHSKLKYKQKDFKDLLGYLEDDLTCLYPRKDIAKELKVEIKQITTIFNSIGQYRRKNEKCKSEVHEGKKLAELMNGVINIENHGNDSDININVNGISTAHKEMMIEILHKMVMA